MAGWALLWPDEACSTSSPQELRNQWGRVLFEFQMRGLFEHRLLHADPNLANFAFRKDGRVVVYDFGCVKAVPEALARSYAGLARALLEERREDIPDLLVELGVYRKGGEALEGDLVEPYVELFADVFRAEPAYAFGEDEGFYDRILELGAANWSRSMDLHFPEDIVFVDRSPAGHLGNLTRLGARGPWRDLLDRYSAAVAC